KREFRSLWIQRINAAARQHGLTYSQLMGRLAKQNIGLNRKVLEFHEVACGKDFDDIAIGYETHLGIILEPKVIVFDHHQVVTCSNLVVAEQDAVANGLIEKVCPLVAAAHENDILGVA
ncbi:MAG: mitochondrial large ribosomal subunit protein bL20m, partial [Bacteroidales bacterium]|nr:mitochondrial large ribosomal subunit protein bL20m [Bacteroidales bacterium]